MSVVSSKKHNVSEILSASVFRWGTRWRSWLRHYATSRKVAGSIPDGVIGIFIDILPVAL